MVMPVKMYWVNIGNYYIDMQTRYTSYCANLIGSSTSRLSLHNNIWHLYSLSVDESQGYVSEIRVSLRYTL